MPGVTSDYVRIDLTAERPHAEVVMTFTGNKILGIRDNTAIVSGWNVYPNPVADQITVNLNMNRGARAEIGIYNLAGQMMLGTRAVLGEGENRIGVSTASLAPGIYSLRILSPDGLIINTKLVKTR